MPYRTGVSSEPIARSRALLDWPQPAPNLNPLRCGGSLVSPTEWHVESTSPRLHGPLFNVTPSDVEIGDRSVAQEAYKDEKVILPCRERLLE